HHPVDLVARELAEDVVAHLDEAVGQGGHQHLAEATMVDAGDLSGRQLVHLGLRILTAEGCPAARAAGTRNHISAISRKSRISSSAQSLSNSCPARACGSLRPAQSRNLSRIS